MLTHAPLQQEKPGPQPGVQTPPLPVEPPTSVPTDAFVVPVTVDDFPDEVEPEVDGSGGASTSGDRKSVV